MGPPKALDTLIWKKTVGWLVFKYIQRFLATTLTKQELDTAYMRQY